MSDPTRPLAVPSSRLSRGVRTGTLTARLMAGMLPGATRALASGRRPDPREMLLTPANMQRLTSELARMRGAAMKLGQLLSMESGDLVPPELAQILARLRADAHHMPPAQLKRVLLDQYGPDALKRFRRFDPRPVAAASIGQVHRAVAQDGRELALKIQYPGIRAAIDADVANLGTLMRYSGLVPAGLDLAPLLDEARTQLHEEADYTREARELTRFADLLADDPEFALPRPHADLSTADILAMDYMPGRPIETVEETDQATRDRVAARLIRLYLREVFDWGQVQTDPNFANFFHDPDSGRTVLLDFGAARSFDAALVDRFRRLMRATAQGEREAIRNALYDIGYMRPETPAAQQETILRMTALVSGALQGGVFDFGDTTLLDRMRREGERLGMEQGFAEVPPMDALFLQRKLAGIVLLATRLRARVDIAAVMAPYLSDAPRPEFCPK
ncbi:ABC1 kinase family protein [Pseudoponticoccus marisrubri]|uniref:ABC1 atypical kinase-like domain-containing protein n=1 Tax=Pseudoponticoccus marisrubri TaxID=1685382 RepID=A0A0W7WH32_9RHOB|nr:AarF/ABC1/UbiB kinase family protein [Pseudoponticoccus marisrubri]KUF09790.1 hypothetical protein AVJ23_15170 [Pseudoponticoccus marisrubri]